jgi:hypothetical protein
MNKMQTEIEKRCERRRRERSSKKREARRDGKQTLSKSSGFLVENIVIVAEKETYIL